MKRVIYIVLSLALFQIYAMDNNKNKLRTTHPKSIAKRSNINFKTNAKQITQGIQNFKIDKTIATSGMSVSDKSSQNSLKILRDPDTNLPRFVAGKLKSGSPNTRGLQKRNIVTRIPEYLTANRTLIGLEEPDQEFKFKNTHVDFLGQTHIRLQQVYQGIEVWGSDMVLHVDSNSDLVGFNGRYQPTPSQLNNLKPTISQEQASNVALQHVGTNNALIEKTHLTIFNHEKVTAPTLAYQLIIRNGHQLWHYFIDAHSSQLIHRINYTRHDGPATGSGTDLQGNNRTLQLYQKGSQYYMVDVSQPMYNAGKSKPPTNVTGGIVIYDAKNQDPEEGTGNDIDFVTSTSMTNWPANAVSAASSAQYCYNYFRQVHGRNSYDGKGANVYMVINLAEEYSNAFWDGRMLWFGNGDGDEFSDFVGGLDVVGHEFTHGVNENSAGLIYENQSGAIDEGLANIFGEFIENFAEGSKTDWLSGEDIFTPKIDGDAMNDLENPRNDNPPSPSKMSEYENLPNTEDGDNGGVHVNSTIVSRACVLLANAVGIDKAERIIYHTQQNYLTQNSQFIDLRLGMEKSANDIYGQTEVDAVKQAFDTVEIGIVGTTTPTDPPVEYDPLTGDQFLLVTDLFEGQMYLTVPDENQRSKLTNTPIFSKPAASSDGSFILFVDMGNDLNIINTDGSEEENLTAGSELSGFFWSIALSPNNRYVSFTSVEDDSTLYVMDLEAEDIYDYPLYTPIFDGTWLNDVVYADAMDWTNDNQYIIYDCMHQKETNFDDPIVYWSIQKLRISDGKIFNVFGKLPEGMSMGNPSLANTNDYILLYDFTEDKSEEIVYSEIRSKNIETGEEGVVVPYNDAFLGFPEFDPNDEFVYFHGLSYDEVTEDFTGEGIIAVEMASNKMDGKEDIYDVMSDVTFPIWITMAEETGVQSTIQPDQLSLSANYPNPFNPETEIQYQLPASGQVELTIYNVQGRAIQQLINQNQPAGIHTVHWNGEDAKGLPVASGVYYYQLNFDDRKINRKMLLIR